MTVWVVVLVRGPSVWVQMAAVGGAVGGGRQGDGDVGGVGGRDLDEPPLVGALPEPFGFDDFAAGDVERVVAQGFVAEVDVFAEVQLEGELGERVVGVGHVLEACPQPSVGLCLGLCFGFCLGVGFCFCLDVGVGLGLGVGLDHGLGLGLGLRAGLVLGVC